jgi:hypothetical protein
MHHALLPFASPRAINGVSSTSYGTAMAKAIDYNLSRSPALIRLLDDGTLPIDNKRW